MTAGAGSAELYCQELPGIVRTALSMLYLVVFYMLYWLYTYAPVDRPLGFSFMFFQKSVFGEAYGRQHYTFAFALTSSFSFGLSFSLSFSLRFRLSVSLRFSLRFSPGFSLALALALGSTEVYNCSRHTRTCRSICDATAMSLFYGWCSSDGWC